MAQPGYYVFEEMQGASFNKVLRWYQPDGSPINLAGLEIKMALKKSYDAEASHTLTQANGGITVTPEEGKIELFIPADVMAALEPVAYLFDIELDNTLGQVDKLLTGRFHVRREVTTE